MAYQNLHTHTTMSDGRDTPVEMIERAIELGFDSIGISDHACTELFKDIEIKVDGYRSTVLSLRSNTRTK